MLNGPSPPLLDQLGAKTSVLGVGYSSRAKIKDRLVAVSPNPIFYALLYYLMRVEVPSVLLLTLSSFGLNDTIVLVVDLFKTRSSSAVVMLNVIDLPLIAQVPPIVPVTAWPSVLLMKPTGRTWATKLPLALNDMDSLTSPTMLVPNQSPTIVAEYSASLTGAIEHDVESPQATSTPNKDKRVSFLDIDALSLVVMF